MESCMNQLTSTLLISTLVNYVNIKQVLNFSIKNNKTFGGFNGKMVEIEGMNHYIQPNNLSSALG